MQNKPRDHGAERGSGSGSVGQPPRLAQVLLRLFSPAAEREALLGDLAEEYRRYHLPRSRTAAARWYWGQTMRSLVPGLQRPGKERVPGARTGDGLVTNLLQDVRYGARSLIKAPTYTLLSVLTLTLAIGLNSAIFSMVNELFFSDMPMTDTDRVAFLFTQNAERGARRVQMSLPEFLDYREALDDLAELGAVGGRAGVLSGVDEPARVSLATATANVFRVWGTPPGLGRTFLDGEDAPGAERVAILSQGIWDRRFGSDPAAVGSVVKIDGYPTTVIGVASPLLDVGDMRTIDIWVPMDLDPTRQSRDDRDLFVTARLAPAATLEQLIAEAEAVAQRLAARYPETHRGWASHVQSFREGLADDAFFTVLFLLGIAVSMVLALACSNVATMTLARASGRSQELAVRAALGAGRRRILRQLLTESLMLSLASGLVGLMVARWSLVGLTWMAGDASNLTPFFASLAIDRNVMLFTLAVALLAPLLFGALPALRASRADLASTLKEGGRSSGASSLPGRRVLVATQVSLAIVLMVVAGLVIRSLLAIRSVDVGYDTGSILTMRVDLPEATYPTDEQVRVFREAVLERVQGLAGVVRATWVSDRKMADPMRVVSLEIEQAELRSDEQAPRAYKTAVGPAYFDMLRLQRLSGRLLSDSDTAAGERVAVINATAAERFWGKEEPVGGRIRASGREWMTVVGLVADEVMPGDDNAARPQLYTALAQESGTGAGLLVEALGDPLALAPAIREAVWNVDPEQPVADVRTERRIFADELATMDSVAGMFAAFAFFAMVMAAAGIYGVLSFTVAQRTREIGIRMALGAEIRDVRGMVMRNSAGLIALGALLGLVGAFMLGRILAGGITGIDASDPIVFGAVILLLSVVAGLAAWVPARRATRVDPVIALKSE